MNKYSIWKDEATNTYEVVRWINNKCPVIEKAGFLTKDAAKRFVEKEQKNG